ncbi:MAG: hypothetical protein QXS20_08195 [Candidatus Thorarchaeota archaeon]
MPREVHAIWWDDNLGPLVGRSYPEDTGLTSEEALRVFMGHGIHQEAPIGYTNLGKGLVVSLMRPPNCIAVVLEQDEDPLAVERAIIRVCSEIDFNSDRWGMELRHVFERIQKLLRSASLDELIARPEIRRLMEHMGEGRVPVLAPEHVLISRVRYPVAMSYLGPDEEETTRVLHDLEAAGLLVARSFGRRLVCRQCGQSEVRLTLTCPRCGSSRLHGVYGIFCPHCSSRTVAVLPDEMTEVSCQQCKGSIPVSELRVLDVEILCADCGNSTVDASIVLHCAACGRQLTNVDMLGATGLAYYPKTDG